MKTNISLIGMPTSGKTYLGERLAKELDFSWTDFDHEITRRYNHLTPIADEKIFLRYEEDTILDAKGVRTIFSCGGSSVYSMPAMYHLKSISTIIYLKITDEILNDRQVDYVKRGVIGAQNKSIEQLHLDRQSLYERYADFTIEPSSNIDEQFTNLLLLSNQIVYSNKSL